MTLKKEESNKTRLPLDFFFNHSVNKPPKEVVIIYPYWDIQYILSEMKNLTYEIYSS